MDEFSKVPVMHNDRWSDYGLLNLHPFSKYPLDELSSIFDCMSRIHYHINGHPHTITRNIESQPVSIIRWYLLDGTERPMLGIMIFGWNLSGTIMPNHNIGNYFENMCNRQPLPRVIETTKQILAPWYTNTRVKRDYSLRFQPGFVTVYIKVPY